MTGQLKLGHYDDRRKTTASKRYKQFGYLA